MQSLLPPEYVTLNSRNYDRKCQTEIAEHEFYPTILVSATTITTFSIEESS